MAKKIEFIGMPISELKELISSENNEQIIVRKAKLIPVYKIGEEMALTSVFLSAIKLIKEFRKMISENINLLKTGKLHIFTEVTFKEFENKRIDGLILVEKGNKIVDAAIFEMKNGKNELEINQINSYINIADKYNIPKLVTISNQFVSHPTQSPIQINKKRNVSAYHLSWTYILTIAHILLTDNETNISDPDQIEIMREVVDYFEHGKSGVCGFKVMKDGWKNITEKINKQESFKETDRDVKEAVESWVQEERDMALKLSQELGILVNSGMKKYREDLSGRIEEEKKNIIERHSLTSMLNIKDAASNIKVSAFFALKNFEFSTSLTAPQDKKTIRGQIGEIKKQIKRMVLKNPDGFEKYQSNILVELKIKNIRTIERVSISELDNFADRYKDKLLKECGFVLIYNIGKDFGTKYKCIELLESTLIEYYKLVVQNIVKWVKPVPEIKNKSNDEILE